jgi:hypothetical protein
VTFSAFDDNWVETGPQRSTIRHVLSSQDPAYDTAGVCVEMRVNGTCARRVAASVPDVTVAIVDDDVAGLTSTPSKVSLAEGGAPAMLTLALTSRPLRPVSVTVVVGPLLVATPASLVFLPTGPTSAALNITAVNDHTAMGNHSVPIAFSLASTGADYASVDVSAVSVEVELVDDDVAGVRANATGLMVLGEGDAAGALYTLVLSSQPLSTVRVTVVPSVPSTVVLSPNTVTFVRGQWNVPATLRVVRGSPPPPPRPLAAPATPGVSPRLPPPAPCPSYLAEHFLYVCMRQ